MARNWFPPQAGFVSTPLPNPTTHGSRGRRRGFPNELPEAKRMAGERGKTGALPPKTLGRRPTLSSGMKGPMDLSEVLSVHVGVDLGGGDVGVAQKLLNGSQVGAPFQEVGCEAVSEGVG